MVKLERVHICSWEKVQGYVHSFNFKEKTIKEKLLNSENPPVWSSFRIELVDKTILMSGFRFKN